MRCVSRAGCLAILLGGCGAHAATGSGAAPPSVSAETAPAASSVPLDDLEVHEWGLIRAEAGDVLRVGAVAPPVTFAPIVMEKPVLYFHAGRALTLRSVSVRIEGGHVAETWPFVPMGAEARWSDVTIDPGADCTPTPLPSATDAPCAALPAGEACESPGLAVVRTTDAACVSTGGATERFLFYRAQVERFTPPLVFERVAGSERVRVTNEGELPIPGLLVRIEASYGSTRTLAVSPPAPHASIEVGADFDAALRETSVGETPVRVGEDLTEHIVEEERMARPSTIAPGRAALARSLMELGLTAPETEAFLAAWGDTLFGRPGEIAEQTPPPSASFVYFLPEARVDALAPLTIDPPPAPVHRAMAVWSPLAASGPSH